MKKPEFVYPGSDFDRSRALIALLGSFWMRTFAAKDQVSSYTTATGQLLNQTYKNILEVAAAMSRFDVPLFHEQTIVPIVLKKSELNTVAVSGARFDDAKIAFDSDIVFDQPYAKTYFAFPLPEKLAAVGQLFNRTTFPTVALLSGADFIVSRDRDALIFAQNPFDNAGFARRLIAANGVEDEEITMWGFCGQFDYEWVFNQFAYAVGIQLGTSQGYKDLMNAVISGLIDGGATVKTLDLAIAAICGVPVSLEPEETVEVIDYDARGLFVATDKAVYRFSATAAPNVVVTQTITAGTQLIRGIDIKEFFLGNALVERSVPLARLVVRPETDPLALGNTDPAATPPCFTGRTELAALALDHGFLAICCYGDLVFENAEVPLEVISDHPTGYTYLRFKLGGIPADADAFFDEMHYRGVLEAQAVAADKCPPPKRRGTLAHLLDKRTAPDSEPTAAHLPKTINPLRFLVENVLRNNVFVVRISVPALGQNGIGLYNIRHLRQLLPPQTGMIVVFELAAGTDTVTPKNNITEAVKTFTGMTPQKDTVVNLVRDAGATARLVSGTCQ